MKILIALLFVHWLGDYTHLSTPWMLQAKRFGKPVMPIIAHAAVHAVLTSFVLTIYGKAFWSVTIGTLIMLVTHSVVDVLKGRMNGWFPKLQSPANPIHWYVFGLDQTLHILVLILIASL